jgi:hypothetical protein
MKLTFHIMIRIILFCACYTFALIFSLSLSAAVLPDSLGVKQGARLTWDFENGSNGWSQSNSIGSLHASHGSLRGLANGSDPYVFDPQMKLAIKGAGGVAVRVWFSSSAPLQLYWANEDGDYSEARQATAIVPGNQWTTVWFNLASHPGWAGKTLSKIRLDPGDVGVDFVIEHVSILDAYSTDDLSFVSHVIDFTNGLDGWTQWDLADFRGQEGKLRARTAGNDPQAVSPLMSWSGLGGLLVHVKCSHACDLKLYWATTEGGFSEERSLNVPIDGNGYWQLAMFDLRHHPEWAGKTITRLRLDPGSWGNIQFEIDNITLLSPAAFLDSDGDRLSAVEEAIYRTSPSVRDSVPYRLTEEKWSGLNHYSTSTLVSHREFYGKPDAVGYGRLESANYFGDPNAPAFFATRHRGYLVAPDTGYYRFWISGRSGVELSLSSSSSKYQKKRIAQINPEIGTSYGIDTISSNLWDTYSSQMSHDIYLEAGKRYYLEAIQTTGHVGGSHLRIAWARPGMNREILSTDYLQSYFPTSDDGDDDYLPDAWECQYGLSPFDNGHADLENQGERGDFDADGLTNREEYLLGTDPSDSDTDGDGETDGDEYNSLGTDAFVSTGITDTFLSSINLANFSSTTSHWSMTSGGLLADSFRGQASWNFSVPRSGNWLFRLELELLGLSYGNEEVPVLVQVNGQTITRKQVRFGRAKKGLLQALSHWLPAGNHQITVMIDNALARRTVRVVSLGIFAPANPASILARSNRVINHPATTRTSPASLEGFARNPSSVSINQQAAINGLGQGHWFANIPLENTSQAQSYQVLFEHGSVSNGSFTWQATNVMDGETLTIRQGDTLRIGAWGGNLTEPATITAPSGMVVTLSGQNCVPIAFPQPGTFSVLGQLSSGATAALTVHVIAPPSFISPVLDTLENSVRSLTVAAAPQVAFDVHADLCRLTINRNANQVALGIAPLRPVDMAVVARLFEGGPILSLQKINVISVSDALQNDLTASTVSHIPGYKILATPMTILNLPPGARIEVGIFRAGVMFLNGATVQQIHSSAVINGSVHLEFLFPLGMPGGYCHHVSVFDRNGILLGIR